MRGEARDTVLQNSEKRSQPLNATHEAAQIAGVSTDTISRVKKIEASGDEELKRKAEVLRPRAKANQGHGQTAPGKTLWQNSAKRSQPLHVRNEAAQIAGVSTDTISRVKKIEASGDEELKRKAEVLRPRAKANQGHGQTAPGKTLWENSRKALPPVPPVDVRKEAAQWRDGDKGKARCRTGMQGHYRAVYRQARGGTAQRRA